MSIVKTFNDITVSLGGTADTSNTLTGAIDALTDALAGEDVESPKTVEGAIKLLGEYVGKGEGGSSSPSATQWAYIDSREFPLQGNGNPQYHLTAFWAYPGEDDENDLSCGCGTDKTSNIDSAIVMYKPGSTMTIGIISDIVESPMPKFEGILIGFDFYDESGTRTAQIELDSDQYSFWQSTRVGDENVISVDFDLPDCSAYDATNVGIILGLLQVQGFPSV